MENILSMMKVETWMNSEDALDNGFVDTVTDSVDIAAKISAFSKHFKSLPIENESRIDEIESLTDYERFLRDSGIPKRLATALTSRAKVIFRGEPDEQPSALMKIAQRLDGFRLPNQVKQ